MKRQKTSDSDSDSDCCHSFSPHEEQLAVLIKDGCFDELFGDVLNIDDIHNMRVASRAFRQVIDPKRYLPPFYMLLGNTYIHARLVQFDVVVRSAYVCPVCKETQSIYPCFARGHITKELQHPKHIAFGKVNGNYTVICSKCARQEWYKKLRTPHTKPTIPTLRCSFKFIVSPMYSFTLNKILQ